MNNRSIYVRCRRLRVFCILSFSCLQLSATNPPPVFLTPISQVSTGKLSLDADIVSCIYKDDVYWFTSDDWNNMTGTLKIYHLHTAEQKTDSFFISIPKEVKINNLPSISINEKFMILTDDNRFEQYRYILSGSKYTFSNKIMLPDSSACNRVMPLTRRLFLFECLYNFHPGDNLYKTNLGVFDAELNRFVAFIHPQVPCIAFSHLLHQWTATNDRLIALASPCGYKILFYDFNLQLVDSINYNSPGWNDLPGQKIPFETDVSVIHPKLLIDKLLAIDSISRIERIYFLDNSTLMVSSTGKNLEDAKRMTDLWKIPGLEKPWLSTLNTIELSSSDTLFVNRQPLRMNSYLDIGFMNGKQFAISDEDYFETVNRTVKENAHRKDLYYETHDPHFSINIFKVNLP
jgi:hypothetical protein